MLCLIVVILLVFALIFTCESIVEYRQEEKRHNFENYVFDKYIEEKKKLFKKN